MHSHEYSYIVPKALTAHTSNYIKLSATCATSPLGMSRCMASAAGRYTLHFPYSSEFELEAEPSVELVLAFPSDETCVEVDGAHVVDADSCCVND